MLKRCAFLSTLSIILISSLIVSCSEDEKSPTSLDPPDYDISGTWAFSEIADETDCGDGVNAYNWDAEITQDGNDLTVEMENETFSGTISASTVSWQGSFAEDGGTTTILSLTLTVQEDGTEMQGNSSWRWSGGGDSCAGTSDLTATKQD